MEDDFYATIKFKNGEEIFTKVAASEEEDRTMLVIHNPITAVEIKQRGQMVGYKIEPWLKTTKEDMFLINIKDVLTMSESNDVEMITMHQSFVRKSNLTGDGSSKYKLDRKMGYIANINDAKSILEKIYKTK